ncbi:MAG: tetratricopeptide repeat protein [Symploca sp. SIO3C6]|nr:tetratricopeptide repeat protein [Symploca sp. SIO3C6]
MRLKPLHPISVFVMVVAVNGMGAAQAENLEQTQQLLSTRECRNCDLSDVSLVYNDLSRVNLQGADLQNANLSHVDLSGANLSGADLRGATLFNADLSDADLSNANLDRADLRQAYLVDADFEEASLDDALLQGAIGLPDTVASLQFLYDMGLAEADRGNFEEAYRYYTRILELRPDEPTVYLARSLARYHVADVGGAIADANQAEALFTASGDVEGQLMAAGLSQRIIDQQEAIAEGPSAGRPNFLNLLESIVPFVFQFAF